MRPDRIIVGEVRGAEAMSMLQALSTGHSGSVSSIHANSCRDALRRLETMVLMGMDMPLAAIQGLIASSVDILIHLGRLTTGKRKILEICEIKDYSRAEYLQIISYMFLYFQYTLLELHHQIIEEKYFFQISDAHLSSQLLLTFYYSLISDVML